MASSPASMPSPMATSASSIVWPGSRCASNAPTRAHSGNVGPDGGPHRPHDLDEQLGPRLRPSRPSGRRAGCCSARGTRGGGSRGRRGARCRRSRPRGTRRAASTNRSTTQARSSSVATCTRYAAVGDANGAISVGRLLRGDHARQRVGRRRVASSTARAAAGPRRCRGGCWCRRARAGRRWWRRGGGPSSARRRSPGSCASSDAAIWRASKRCHRVGDGHRADDHQAGAAAGARLEPGGLGVADGAVGLARFVPIGHIAIRLRQLQRPEAPRRQQVGERRSPQLVGVGVGAGDRRDERGGPEHLADAVGARARRRRPAARPTTCRGSPS